MKESCLHCHEAKDLGPVESPFIAHFLKVYFNIYCRFLICLSHLTLIEMIK